jgi:hypothetical protein
VERDGLKSLSCSRAAYFITRSESALTSVLFWLLSCLYVTVPFYTTAKEIGDSAMARTLCGTSEYMVRCAVLVLYFIALRFRGGGTTFRRIPSATEALRLL